MHLSASTNDVKDHNTENQPHDTLFHHSASRSATKLRTFFGAFIHCSRRRALSLSVCCRADPRTFTFNTTTFVPNIFWLTRTGINDITALLTATQAHLARQRQRVRCEELEHLLASHSLPLHSKDTHLSLPASTNRHSK